MRTIILAGTMIFFALAASAQSDVQVMTPVGPDGYPAAAHAVRATGEVIVEIHVSPDGKVIAAKAVRGHLLLRSSSERAAFGWEFSKIAASGPRSANLFFTYSIGDFRHIESSERSEAAYAAVSFPSEFAVEIVHETLIPRLLLLPRTNGTIKEQNCELHDQQMAIDIQKRCDSTSGNFGEIRSDSSYNSAEETLFPQANIESYGTCRGIEVERAETYYCSICRIERDKWLVDNK
jgi:hypothetical protein